MRAPAVVGLYNESAAGSIGGSEYVIAVLAEALARRQQRVEIVHHQPDLTAATLEGFCGVSLGGVTMRYVEKQRLLRSDVSMPWQIWRESRSWHAELSRPYDVFVNVGHWIPPFCHARRGILMVLFPLFAKQRQWPWNEPASGLRDRARRLYYDWEWRKRIGSYQTVVSISEFTRRWTKEYWGADSSIVYPPVAVNAPATLPKTDTIVSVGRFATIGHPKRHEDLIRAFVELDDLHTAGWSYESLGALGPSAADQEYFADLQVSATRGPVHLRPNLARAEVLNAYARAKVFVHAAGFGVPDDRPDMTEHFGIATVEAMSAGCVPVVVNRGGQPEIVEHGVSGFVWNTIPELQRYLRLLATDEPRRDRMAAAARERSRRFSSERFIQAMLDVIDCRSDAVVDGTALATVET